jgi:hypothetical protein
VSHAFTFFFSGDFLILHGEFAFDSGVRKFLICRITSINLESEDPLTVQWYAPKDEHAATTGPWHPLFKGKGGRARHTDKIVEETVNGSFKPKFVSKKHDSEVNLPDDVIDFLKRNDLC